MARVQLALNVGNLDEAITFYSQIFNCPPAKVRPGYANFAVDDPPLKLVLIEGHGTPGTMNHVGVELASPDEVKTAISNAVVHGLAHDVHESQTCCFAVQDKMWVHGPDVSWEWYTVLDDAPDDTSLSVASKELVSLAPAQEGLTCDVQGGECC